MFPSDSDFESKFTFEDGSGNLLPEEPPFHLLLLGNWSGRPDAKDLSVRRPIEIDRDNFEDVFRRLDVGLEMDLNADGDNRLRISFDEIDDFHPDHLFRKLPIFEELRDLRRRLSKADSYERAAREVRAWFEASTPGNSAADETPVLPAEQQPGSLLDAILSQPESSSAVLPRKRTDETELGRLISQVVAPFLIRVDEAEQSELISVVDQATGQLMRSILHQESFQSLEAAWRGLYFLVRRLETDRDLKVFIFDVAKSELMGNLKEVNNLADSFWFRLLAGGENAAPGAKSWAVIGGNFEFNLAVDDAAALMRLAQLAEAAGAPFVSYIKPEMFGVGYLSNEPDLNTLRFLPESVAGKLWSTLRSIPESNFIGLSPTRLLARLPYGRSSDPTEVFEFEEFSGNFEHRHYLWSNPCFAISLLLARSFRLYGWEIGADFKRDIEDLPLHIYQQEGETAIKPAAEVFLTEKFAEELLAQGLMPFVSFKNSEQVRLARLQSISNPLRNLAGKWQ